MMTRRRFLKLAGASAMLPALGAASSKRPPNVVLVVIDDMGQRDLGCYGSDYYETPHIDALAAQGVRFTQFYAASPVCSPTRASILCGKYPARLHMTYITTGVNPEDRPLLAADHRRFLPFDETTLGEAFRDAGYATACIGKWHLGETHDPENHPENHGFDFVRMHGPSTGDKFVSVFTDTALEFIETHRDRPFFLYLPHHTVHVPFEATETTIEKYRGKQPGASGQNNPVMAAMVEELDRGMGRLLAGLDRLGLTEDTIVVFTSDNGGLRWVRDDDTGEIVTATNNAPLRAGKAQLYEGGTRVPFIVRWPGRVEGGREVSTLGISADIYPSLFGLAGLPLQPDPQRDGIDILGPIGDGSDAAASAVDREALFWHFPHYHASTKPCGAVRRGDMKLIEHYEDGTLELYDLARDVGETHDLASERPELARELRALLHRHLDEVGAQMPTPNPAFTQTDA